MNYLIGLDIGTTAIKGAIITTEGKVLDTFSGGYHYYGEGNAKLMKPSDFLDTCYSVIKRLAGLIGKDEKVLSICACCASGNLIMLDKNDQPLIPIIGWQSALTEKETNELFTPEEIAAFYHISGWPFGGQFPAAYLAWIHAHRPELIEQASAVAMSAEYLAYSLTGKWGISHSMGTPSFLMDQEKGIYNLPLLQKLEIAEEKLPPIYDKGSVLGTIKPEVAQELGLSEQTAFVLGSFDHPSGAMGAGVFEMGEMLLSCGTSWVEFFPVPSREFAISTNGLVDRFMLNGAPYCVMKSISSVSEKIDARREHYLGKISHNEFADLASQSSMGCNGLRFTYEDSDFTIAEGFDKCHIARAIIEGAAVILRDNLAELEQCGLQANSVTMIGGISNSPVCVGIVSEVLGKPVKVVNGQLAGALGACLLGGIGVGVYQNEKSAFAILQK